MRDRHWNERTASGSPQPTRTCPAVHGRLCAAIIGVAICLAAVTVVTQGRPGAAVAHAGEAEVPAFLRRGMPGDGHAAIGALAGSWRVHYEVYGTLGRSGDEPPIVSDDLRTRREWVGDGRFLEDTTVGTLMGAPYWRKGWLGYNNMGRQYEWITIDAINSSVMGYTAPPGSGPSAPITMTGAFVDQGVAGEAYVGKTVGMKTVIHIEHNDRHRIDLYFTPPGKEELLAVRAVYVRAGH